MIKTLLILEQEDSTISIQKIRLGLREQYIAITMEWNGENWNSSRSAVCATFGSLWQTLCFTTDPFSYSPVHSEIPSEPALKVMQQAYAQKTKREDHCEFQKKEWLEFLKLES